MVALVIAEHDNGSLKGATHHTVTAAAQCGGDVHVLVAGHNAAEAAKQAAAIAGVSKVCGTLITHRPFDYEFLDQQYASLYQSETRMQSIAVVFATLSVAIACLGLFGLVAFSAGQKRKEMGIRKVLGATATGIVFLIARDFARLVVVATVAGLPVAYWIMSTYWLNGFVYKTEIGAAPFFVASALSVVIALVTTAYQAVKASRVNPADILRSE